MTKGRWYTHPVTRKPVYTEAPTASEQEAENDKAYEEEMARQGSDPYRHLVFDDELEAAQREWEGGDDEDDPDWAPIINLH